MCGDSPLSVLPQYQNILHKCLSSDPRVCQSLSTCVEEQWFSSAKFHVLQALPFISCANWRPSPFLLLKFRIPSPCNDDLCSSNKFPCARGSLIILVCGDKSASRPASLHRAGALVDWHQLRAADLEDAEGGEVGAGDEEKSVWKTEETVETWHKMKQRCGLYFNWAQWNVQSMRCSACTRKVCLRASGRA